FDSLQPSLCADKYSPIPAHCFSSMIPSDKHQMELTGHPYYFDCGVNSDAARAVADEKSGVATLDDARDLGRIDAVQIDHVPILIVFNHVYAIPQIVDERVVASAAVQHVTSRNGN